MQKNINEKVSPVLFIGGIGRSGSTVFELSLGTDARVVALGEVIHLWQRCLIDGEKCGCGSPFLECPFWKNVGDEAFGGWDQIDPARIVSLKRQIDRTVRVPQLLMGVGGERWKEDVEEYASYYTRLYRAALHVSGAEIAVDSSKQASLPYVLAQAREVSLRVVHCVRDSRAVAWSWTKKVSRPESSGGDSQYMTRYSPALLALKWLQHNGVIEALRLKGVPMQRIRYEDWAEEPTSTVQAALQFAGLSLHDNPRLGGDWVQLPTNHTSSGNPMRFSRGRIEIRRDEKWRESLSWSSRALVTILSAPGLLAYGYFIPRGRGRKDN